MHSRLCSLCLVIEDQLQAGKMLAIEETPTESDSGELIAAALDPDDETPQLTEPELSIFHGESVTDRKSTFQSHVVEVHSVNEVLQSNVNEMIV